MRARREHGERRRIEPAPQLPQVGLDAAHLGREVVGHQQVGHGGPAPGARCRVVATERPGGPPGVLGQHRIVIGHPVAQGSAVGRIVTASDVAQGDQRIPAEVAGIAAGDVPAAVGRPAARRRRRPAGRAGRRRAPPRPRRRAGGGGRSASRLIGTDLLALVAAVDAAAQGPAVLLGERSRGLHQPGQAPSGVEHAGLHQGTGRARACGSGRTIRTRRRAGRLERGRRRERRVGDHAAEDEPRARARQQERASSCRTSRGRHGGRPPGRPERCRRRPPRPASRGSRRWSATGLRAAAEPA